MERKGPQGEDKREKGSRGKENEEIFRAIHQYIQPDFIYHGSSEMHTTAHSGQKAEQKKLNS